MDHDELQQLFEQNEARYIEEWKEFLRIPSISTDPEYAPECDRCANWLIDRLKAMGLKTELLPTSGKPVVYGLYEGKPGATTITLYGHYDVQPVDPVELWESDPFEPELRDGRLYARGAQDNKGQVTYFLMALEALINADALNCTLKICLEGEEECGSKGITASLDQFADKLKADILMVCDTGSRDVDIAAITMGLRGVIGCTVVVDGLRTDLHSGLHGGVAPNPAQALCKLAASLHSPDGSIAVEGFYDGIVEPDQENREAANKVDIPVELYKKMSGTEPVGGEQGYTFAERRGFRPTLEINGMNSGYSGPGMKTIIPSQAVLKLSARTVVGQDPKETLKRIEDHLQKHAPQGLRLQVTDKEDAGGALCLNVNSEHVVVAREVLSEIFEGKVELMWEGASIPVVGALAETIGAEPLLVGFGVEEDSIHAPNESFSLTQFRRGFLYVGMLLSRL